MRRLWPFLLVSLMGGVIGGVVTWWAFATWGGQQLVAITASTPTRPPDTPTLTIAPSASPTETIAPTSTAAPPPTMTPTPTALPSTATPVPDLAVLIEQANEAVVTVINSRNESRVSDSSLQSLLWGSGVLIDSRGYILTNQHVAEGATSLIIALPDGQDLRARYVAGDAAADLALLKVAGATLPQPVRWGNSDGLRLGEPVVVIGSPLGNLLNSVTTGVVSGLNRTVVLEDETEFRGMIQTDAAINRGNSGGALLNRRGELVGIVTLIIRETKQVEDPDVQGIGFAIASAEARPLVGEWIAEDQPRQLDQPQFE